MPIFRVVKSDGSVDTWGVDQDANYEIDRGGNLAVVVFDPLLEGLSHARWVATYRSDEWVDVQAGLDE
jgi:hypothetical protein